MRPGRSLRIAVSTLLALLLGLVSLTPFGQRFELEAGQASLYFLRGTVPPPDEAIVIGLDRGSIEWLELHANDLARAARALTAASRPMPGRSCRASVMSAACRAACMAA